MCVCVCVCVCVCMCVCVCVCVKERKRERERKRKIIWNKLTCFPTRISSSEKEIVFRKKDIDT